MNDTMKAKDYHEAGKATGKSITCTIKDAGDKPMRVSATLLKNNSLTAWVVLSYGDIIKRHKIKHAIKGL